MTRAGSAPFHELRAVIILALGFGLVGVDRFLISTMFPTIARDLGLDYSDIGTIAGALAIAWGLAALLMGNVADRLGPRRVLVGSLVLFSFLIGASGLATSLAGLIAVRVVMGLADGAFTPASISATAAASGPERMGRNIGLQQMTLPLFGLGFAPLVVAALLHIVDWRYIFLIFALPGFALAWATWRYLPGAPLVGDEHRDQARGGLRADLAAVLAYPNIRRLMMLMLCWLTCLIITSAFMPSYLTDFLGLDTVSMGTVMSAIGFGSAAGAVVLAWASDLAGRRTVVLACALGAMISLVALSRAPASAPLLFLALFCVHFFNTAAITLTVGPICAESVPASLMATASGLIVATGELVGGGLGPIVAGHLATRFGIEHLLWLPVAAMAVALLLALGLRDGRITNVEVSP